MEQWSVVLWHGEMGDEGRHMTTSSHKALLKSRELQCTLEACKVRTCGRKDALTVCSQEAIHQ
jgi:hypothetical protein